MFYRAKLYVRIMHVIQGYVQVNKVIFRRFLLVISFHFREN